MSTAVLDGALPDSGRRSPGRAKHADGNAHNNTVDDIQQIPIIELRGIQRTFITGGGVEVRALRGIDLKIHVGEFVAIVGQSGSGKSTMMNILGCLDKPTAGTYLFGGRDIRDFGPDDLAWLRREAFGFVFQSYNLLPHSTALENVEIPAIYAGLNGSERRLKAEALLTSLGLGERMDHRPSQLSGGQQQRVSIARAMINGGNIILADEPTGALDSKSGVEVINLLKSLARQGHTVIIITHDPKLAEHADRIIEFSDGVVISDRHRERPDVPHGSNSKLRELLMSRRTRRKLNALVRSSGSMLATDRDSWGNFIQLWDGIPIGVNDWILDTHTLADSLETATTGGACSTIRASCLFQIGTM